MQDSIPVPNDKNNDILNEYENEGIDEVDEFDEFEEGPLDDWDDQNGMAMERDPEEQRAQERIQNAVDSFSNMFPNVDAREVIEYYARHQGMQLEDAAADIAMINDRREIEDMMRPVLPRYLLEKMGVVMPDNQMQAQSPAMGQQPNIIGQMPVYQQQQTPVMPNAPGLVQAPRTEYLPPAAQTSAMQIRPQRPANSSEFKLVDGEAKGEEAEDVEKGKIDYAKKIEFDLRYKLNKGVPKNMEITLEFIDDDNAYGHAYFKTKIGSIERMFEVPIMLEDGMIQIEQARDVNTGDTYPIDSEEIFEQAPDNVLFQEMAEEYEKNPEKYGKESDEVNIKDVESLHSRFPEIPMEAVREFIYARRQEETGWEPPELLEENDEDGEKNEKEEYSAPFNLKTTKGKQKMALGIAMIAGTALLGYIMVSRILPRVIQNKDQQYNAETFESYKAAKFGG